MSASNTKIKGFGFFCESKQPAGNPPLGPSMPCLLQAASKAQKASVAPHEVERYEQYNERHGAKYSGKDGGPDSGEEEW